MRAPATATVQQTPAQAANRIAGQPPTTGASGKGATSRPQQRHGNAHRRPDPVLQRGEDVFVSPAYEVAQGGIPLETEERYADHAVGSPAALLYELAELDVFIRP